MRNTAYNDIINRVEEVRNRLGLNKSQFSSRIGLKPQTYNNFTGVQGSKPNVALIRGTVEAFGVDPQWLLNGEGATFRDRQPLDRATKPWTSSAGSTEPPRDSPSPEDIAPLRVELEMLLRPFREGAMPMLEQESLHHEQIQMAIQMLTHVFHAAPVETTAQVIQMLDDFQRIAGEMELSRRKQSGSRSAD